MCEGWVAASTADWQVALALLFGRLGAARDQAVLEAEWVPALLAAGAPWAGFALAGDAVDDPVAALREPATTALWLALQGFVSGASTPPDVAQHAASLAIDLPLRDRSAAWLDSLFRQIRRDADRFESLDDESRHRLRRRVKRLRYGIEFSAALFEAKPAVRRFLRPLAAAQEDLGRFNDLVVGLGRMRLQAQTEARAWFGVGWLSAKREAAIAECSVSLKRLGRAERFWRKG
jgi:CHAD domain-containing protein